MLEEIDNRLTHYEEDGKDMVTITKGSQARFSRKGLAYIRNELVPANPDIITRANELIGVYQNRSERIFTGSKWIIGFAIGFGVFIAYIAGLNSFIFIHALGIVFYVLSSRTPIYILEKRMNRINNIGFGKSIFKDLKMFSISLNSLTARVKYASFGARISSGSIFGIKSSIGILLIAFRYGNSEFQY